MAKKFVSNYAVQWNPLTNKGSIQVTVGGVGPIQVPINTEPEFIAIMLMMSKTPVMFDTETKELELDTRPTGT